MPGIAECLAQQLVEAGARRVYGLPGGENVEALDVMLDPTGYPTSVNPSQSPHQDGGKTAYLESTMACSDNSGG